MAGARANKEKQKKPGFFARMVERGREVKKLGLTLKDEPQSFPGELLGLIRRSLRTVWDARGGGLYACGFVVTFVFLEIRMFFLDIWEAESVSGYVTEQVGEMLFKYIGESLQNTIHAFLWPVYFIEIRPPWGVGILAVMYLVFPRYLKAPLERWLFPGETGREEAERKDA